jgi:hypothetical protein
MNKNQSGDTTMQLNVTMRMTAYACIFLTLMMGITPPAVAGLPQPFAAHEMNALQQQAAQNPEMPDLACGTSENTRNIILITVAVVVFLLALNALADTLSDANSM